MEASLILEINRDTREIGSDDRLRLVWPETFLSIYAFWRQAAWWTRLKVDFNKCLLTDHVICFSKSEKKTKKKTTSVFNKVTLVRKALFWGQLLSFWLLQNMWNYLIIVQKGEVNIDNYFVRSYNVLIRSFVHTQYRIGFAQEILNY